MLKCLWFYCRLLLVQLSIRAEVVALNEKVTWSTSGIGILVNHCLWFVNVYTLYRANSSCSRDDTTRDRQPRPDCTTTTVHTSYHHHHRHHHQQQVQQQYGEWRGRPSEMVADRGRRDRYGGREDRRHGGKSDSSEYDLRSKLTGNSSRTVGRDEGYCDQHVRRREWSSGGNRKRGGC